MVINSFNEYFINKASNIISKLNDRKKQFNNDTINKINQNSNLFPNTSNLCKWDNLTIDELLKAISNLKTGSTPGLNKINIEILKI